MANCQRMICTLEIIVRWLTPVLYQEWYTESVLQMWALNGKSYSCVNRLLINFDQFLPKTPKPQNNNGLEPIAVVHLCSGIQMCAAKSIYARSYNAAASLGNWAIAGWGLVARTRRLRGNRLHYWMVAMNRELRYCNN